MITYKLFGLSKCENSKNNCSRVFDILNNVDYFSFFNEEIIHPAASTTQTDAEVAGECKLLRTNEREVT